MASCSAAAFFASPSSRYFQWITIYSLGRRGCSLLWQIPYILLSWVRQQVVYSSCLSQCGRLRRTVRITSTWMILELTESYKIYEIGYKSQRDANFGGRGKNVDLLRSIRGNISSEAAITNRNLLQTDSIIFFYAYWMKLGYGKQHAEKRIRCWSPASETLNCGTDPSLFTAGNLEKT